MHSVYSVSRDRLLVIASLNEVHGVLSAHTQRPIAALLSSRDLKSRVSQYEAVLTWLLESGCSYFICFGEMAEALHDRIDDLAVEKNCLGVVTTWHNNEAPTEIVGYFADVASASDKTLMLAVLEAPDKEMVDCLVNWAREKPEKP